MNNLNAPLGVHIPRLQIIQHSARNSGFFIQLRNREHWVTTSLFILSLTQILSVSALYVFACTRQKQYGGDQLHSSEETGGWVRGQEAMRRWRVGCWVKFKNISDCQTLCWVTAVQQHTFNFIYICCFFHNISNLPYKLMTKMVL